MSNTTISSEVLNLQLASQIVLGYGLLVLIGFGTFGNLLNILVFIRIKSLRQMPNSVFLLASFIGNLVQLWTTRFSLAVLNLNGINLLQGSLFYCELRWFFGRASASVAMTSLCLASIDRFLVTSRNIRFHHVFTVKRARLTVIIMTVIFLIPLIPDIVFYWGPSCISPGAPFEYKQYTYYFNLVLTNYVPVFVLVLFGILTWRNLHIARLGQQNRLEAQVNRMILAELIMVCLTSLPNIVSTTYSLLTTSMVKSQLRTAQDNLWSNVLAVFTVSAYSGSFYVFLIASSAYRKNVKTFLYCKRENQVATQTPTQVQTRQYKSGNRVNTIVLKN